MDDFGRSSSGDSFEQEVEFEDMFYKSICGTDRYEVIPIPDESGNIITPQELKIIKAEAFRQNIKILYRISHGKFATVFDPQTGKIGVMPETNSRGFAC